jgi:hypothetical protein
VETVISNNGEVQEHKLNYHHSVYPLTSKQMLSTSPGDSLGKTKSALTPALIAVDDDNKWI